MTVQALYHYFPNRDALVTALITKAYGELSDVLQAAADSVRADPATPRPVAVAEAYRGWGVARPEHFQLLYGTPLRYYAAPAEGPTTQAVRRMGAIFQRELFAGFTPAQLAAAEVPALSPSYREHLEQLPMHAQGDLPPAAASLFLSAWGTCTAWSSWRCSGTPRSWATIRRRSSARRSG